MFEVRTELRPTKYWLVCRACSERWRLMPDRPILPQTREVLAQHVCEQAEATAEDAGPSSRP